MTPRVKLPLDGNDTDANARVEAWVLLEPGKHSASGAQKRSEPERATALQP